MAYVHGLIEVHLGEWLKFDLVFALFIPPVFGPFGKLLFKTVWGYIRGEYHESKYAVVTPSVFDLALFKG